MQGVEKRQARLCSGGPREVRPLAKNMSYLLLIWARLGLQAELKFILQKYILYQTFFIKTSCEMAQLGPYSSCGSLRTGGSRAHFP